MDEKAAIKTIRQKIISCLTKGPMTSIHISQEVGIMEKEVFHHLDHISRTVVGHGNKMVIQPSNCLKCGFVFDKRTRFTRPGRCPKCKGTRITRPTYEIS